MPWKSWPVFNYTRQLGGLAVGLGPMYSLPRILRSERPGDLFSKGLLTVSTVTVSGAREGKKGKGKAATYT